MPDGADGKKEEAAQNAAGCHGWLKSEAVPNLSSHQTGKIKVVKR